MQQYCKVQLQENKTGTQSKTRSRASKQCKAALSLSVHILVWEPSTMPLLQYAYDDMIHKKCMNRKLYENVLHYTVYQPIISNRQYLPKI